MTETLITLVQQAVRDHPDATALEVGEFSLSYQQLWDAAAHVAGRLVAACGHRPARVALHARRDPTTYVGYLAALRLGATVIPLNPEFPDGRNAKVIATAEAEVVLASDTEVSMATCVVRPEQVFGEPATELPGPCAEDIAYVLFTSGSTGSPKGVPIRHGNVAGYIRYQSGQRRTGPGARLSQTFDLTFDPSVFDLFVAWSSGATLVVPDRSDLHDPVEFVNRRQITHWFSVPSVITLAKRMRRLSPDSMPGLRWSLFAGEQLTWGQAEAWQRAAPASTVENLYGPTELTITCTGYRIPADPEQWPRTHNGTVPIGTPHPGVQTMVLGTEPDRGELCARGAQRFAGYLDPADDAGKFVHDSDSADSFYRTGDLVSRLPSGELVHHGRVDNQVKLHGYRVELGEIEAALRAHDGVEDAVVVLPRGTEEPVACYTGIPAESNHLMDALRPVLPWYMVPSRYRHLDRLPLNDNGKVDRAKLRELACT